jgi:hypothetical protein
MVVHEGLPRLKSGYIPVGSKEWRWRFSIPRSARLEGFDATDLMPARHCPRVGGIIDERIMVERRVECQRQCA